MERTAAGSHTPASVQQLPARAEVALKRAPGGRQALSFWSRKPPPNKPPTEPKPRQRPPQPRTKAGCNKAIHILPIQRSAPENPTKQGARFLR